MQKLIKVLILCPYPKGQAPSQRFRFEQYLDFLKSSGFEIFQFSFLDDKTWAILYKDGSSVSKLFGVIKGFLKRFVLLFQLWKYDFVFIHREATPLGPPIIEWVVAKIFRKKIIYDFDDAIWLPNTSQENKVVAYLKGHWKAKWICKWSYRVSCGNQYLSDFAKNYNSNVIIVPTTIDTRYHKKDSSVHNMKTVIGWTGTHSTEKYLETLIPVIKKLEGRFDFVFRVISNHNPQLPLKSFEYKAWNKKSEIDDLSQFDIGVMPLVDDEWSKGKCGFKGLQYMALEIPSIMSPVGVNKEIITSGVNGFLVNNESDWENALIKLLSDKELRERIGKKGKQTVEMRYSVSSNEALYLSLFSN